LYYEDLKLLHQLNMIKIFSSG